MMRRLADGWLNRPLFDYPITLLVVAAALVVNPTDVLSTDQHGSWYQTLATVDGVLLSLGGVALTLVFTVTPSDRLQRVYDRVGPRLSQLVMSCLTGLLVTTVGFTALFLFETSSHNARVGVSAALVAMTALRFGRLWWLFKRVLEALMIRTPTASTTDRDPWERPVVAPDDYAVPRRRARRVKQ